MTNYYGHWYLRSTEKWNSSSLDAHTLCCIHSNSSIKRNCYQSIRIIFATEWFAVYEKHGQRSPLGGGGNALPFARISLTTMSAACCDWPSPLVVPPRSFTTTLAPREASSKAYSRPRPAPAPVTTATRPSKRSCSELVGIMYAECSLVRLGPGLNFERVLNFVMDVNAPKLRPDVFQKDNA